MSSHYYVHTSPFLHEKEETAYHILEQSLYYQLAQCSKVCSPVLLTRFQQLRQACLATHLVTLSAQLSPRQDADGSVSGNRRAPRSRSRHEFEDSVPRDWRGTGSTKMRLLCEHVQCRLPVHQKMMVFSCYVQALLIAKLALQQQQEVSVFVLVQAMSDKAQRAVLQQFESCTQKAVLLLSHSVAQTLSRLKVCRLLLLDSDWSAAIEQTRLSRFLISGGVITRLLLEESLEEQWYHFLKCRKRKRASELSMYILKRVLAVTVTDSQQRGDEELRSSPPPPPEEEEEEEAVLSLCHPQSLLSQPSLPVGTCVFGLGLNHQNTRWHVDPSFLLTTLFRYLQEHAAVIESPAFAHWMTQQKLVLTLCLVEIPIYRQKLQSHSASRLFPEQTVLSHARRYSPLPLDSKQLLYPHYYYHYYHHSSQETAPFLPYSLFSADTVSSPWQPPSMLQLLQQLFLCESEAVATTLFLALLYRPTPSHCVYYYQAQLEQQPLLFFSSGSELRLVSCDPALLSAAKSALLTALQECTSSTARIHVPLYLGSGWLEQLALPLTLLSTSLSPSCLCTCYQVALLVESHDALW